MTGTDELCAALLRRYRTYHFRTQTAKTVFIICIAAAVIILAFSGWRRSQGRPLSKRTGIIILVLFISMNLCVVILDGILAD